MYALIHETTTERIWMIFGSQMVYKQPPSSINSGEHLVSWSQTTPFDILKSNNTIQSYFLASIIVPFLRISFFSSFENLLEMLVSSHSHSRIMGDFNTCL